MLDKQTLDNVRRENYEALFNNATEKVRAMMMIKIPPTAPKRFLKRAKK